MSAVPVAVIPPPPLPTPSARRLRLPHIRDVGVFGAFLAIFAMTLRPVVDNDLFWHLATGRLMWTTGRIPHADPFSWTAAGRAWIAHEWLTELWLYPLYTHGGYAALMLVFGAVITAAFVVTYATARRLGAPRLIAVPLMLLAAVASDHTWGVRPQMLSMLLMAVTLWLLVRDAMRSPHGRGVRGSLWLLPPLLMGWANLHGGFIFGLALIAVFAVGDTCAVLWSRLIAPAIAAGRAFRLWPVVGACVVACLVNPNGLRGLLYPFTYLGDNASTRYIAEWVSPDFHQLQYQLFEALLLALIAGPLIAARLAPRERVIDSSDRDTSQQRANDRPHSGLSGEHTAAGRRAGVVRAARTPHAVPIVTQLLLALAFTYLALSSVRNINQFSVTVTPLIAAYLALSWRGLRAVLAAPHALSATYGHQAPRQHSAMPAPTAPRLSVQRLPTRRVSTPKGVLNLALAAVLAVAVLLVSAPALSAAHNVRAQAKRFPAGAVAYLRRHQPRGPLFNSYDWGGYLIWSLYPAVHVYVDGRPDMYGDAFMNAFVKTWQAQPGWQATLNRQRVRLVLVEPSSGLGKALAASPSWRLLYHDAISVLYEHRGAR